MLIFFLILVLLYISSAVAIAFLQKTTMYTPSGHPISPQYAGLPTMREISVETSDGLSLLAWYQPPEKYDEETEKPTILFLHSSTGCISNVVDKVKPYIQNGFGLLLLEYRGFGGNEGTPNEENLIEDGLGAYNYLRSLGTSPKNIILYGESLGSGVACALGEKKEIGALVLESSFTSTVDVARLTYWFFPIEIMIFDRFNNLKIIEDIDAPKFFLHGEQDLVVPLSICENLYKKAQGEKKIKIYPEGDHWNLNRFGITNDVISWLDELYIPSIEEENDKQIDNNDLEENDEQDEVDQLKDTKNENAEENNDENISEEIKEENLAKEALSEEKEKDVENNIDNLLLSGEKTKKQDLEIKTPDGDEELSKIINGSKKSQDELEEKKEKETAI